MGGMILIPMSLMHYPFCICRRRKGSDCTNLDS